MSNFEIYGLHAKHRKNFTTIAGRYSIQKEAEKRIFFDILNKLEISQTDNCLDVGCNVGTILIPLSFLVKSITGIDHKYCIEKLKKRFPESENIILIEGDFLDTPLDENYNKIIVYSVIQCLKDEREVFEFIDKSINHLAAGGKILFGDIPNLSKKERFVNSPEGKSFLIEWNKRMAEKNEKQNLENHSAVDYDSLETVKFDDDLILSIIRRLRKKGFHAYILPQPSNLPFGYTREDILVHKPS